MAGRAKAAAKVSKKPSIRKSISKHAVAPSPKSKSTSRQRSKASLKAGVVVPINRAPVLTLWITVCMRRLGYNEDLALTAAKVVTGLCAQAKGKSLGMFPPAAPKTPEERRRAAEERARVPSVKISGMTVPVASPTGKKHDLRACSQGKPLNPVQVERYLSSSFKEHLEAARAAMEQAARRRAPEELRSSALRIYEGFRPEWKGWGVKGELKLNDVMAA
eukprot:TRINITY_DN108873_c0_g1_i1.p1 TRINITY_DN108873_c0_g1~~TRINITY_DN108873_c0_g1_i1.p1  ORF type:complete len:219 (+),score=51.41 TRINITY_DN108873_c0_g1_i1:57-713(+)